MLEYDRVDISEGTDIDQRNEPKECDISHYWYFKNIGCNSCHNLMQNTMNFNDVAILSIKGNDYRIHFWYMSNDDAINIMHNSNLNDKTGFL